MSVKKILLFVMAFVVSCVILTAINQTKSDYIESGVYFVGEYKINVDENINLIFNMENLRLNWLPSVELIDYG